MRRGELRAYSALVAACALAWSILSSFLAGPTIEARYFPVRIDQRVENVTRSSGRPCWDWSSLKVRASATDDLDVFLVVGPERFVVSPFGAIDGQPWRRAAAAPVGAFTKRYCVAVPPHVTEDAGLRVEQTVYYPGPFRLWRVPLHVPDVVYPPEAEGGGR